MRKWYRAIWNRIKKGQLRAERTESGSLRVVVDDDSKKVSVAIYCRVSSSENRDNLERQKQRVLDYCAAKGISGEQNCL